MREIEPRVHAAARADPWLAAHPPMFTWHGDVPPALQEPHVPISATTLDAMASLGSNGRSPHARRGSTAPHSAAPARRRSASNPGLSQVLAVLAMRFCGVEPD
jgi:hypothetical protein